MRKGTGGILSDREPITLDDMAEMLKNVRHRLERLENEVADLRSGDREADCVVPEEKGYLLKDVAKRLGIAPYRIAYALSVGHFPEPGRIAGKRVFREDDITRIAAHFDSA